MEWVRRAARIGHVCVGSVYVLVGALAMAAAIDPRREPTDSVGAFRHLLMDPLGGLVAIALVVGFVADAVWQAVRAFSGSVRGLAGLVQRATWSVRGATSISGSRSPSCV